jgi:hypothetical protein
MGNAGPIAVATPALLPKIDHPATKTSAPGFGSHWSGLFRGENDQKLPIWTFSSTNLL